jgi:hypothetical protein
MGLGLFVSVFGCLAMQRGIFGFERKRCCPWLNGESEEAKVFSAWGWARLFRQGEIFPYCLQKMSGMGLFKPGQIVHIEVEMSDIFLKCSK